MLLDDLDLKSFSNGVCGGMYSNELWENASQAAIFDVNNLVRCADPEIIRLVHKAPLFPPYPYMWLEYKKPNTQFRIGILSKWEESKEGGGTWWLQLFEEKLAECQSVDGILLHAKDFAIPENLDDPDTWVIPIHDIPHVLKAQSLWHQLKAALESTGDYDADAVNTLNRAYHRIKKAALRLGLVFTEDPAIPEGHNPGDNYENYGPQYSQENALRRCEAGKVFSLTVDKEFSAANMGIEDLFRLPPEDEETREKWKTAGLMMYAAAGAEGRAPTWEEHQAHIHAFLPPAPPVQEIEPLLLRNVIGLLNWSREIIPLEKLDMSEANARRKKNGKPPLSSPTIIRFDRLDEYRFVLGAGGTHASPCKHPVRGHMMRVNKTQCTEHEDCSVVLFGQHMKDPVLGKNYGFLRVKPHFRGNPERGEKKTPQYALVEERWGVCEICHKHTRLVYEHNHATNEQRGDCCATCNSSLGLAKDNPENLRRAADYLEKYGHA